MKVAISGASGFVGRHVVAELDRLGVQATLLVRRPAPAAGRHREVLFELDRPDDVFVRAGRPELLIHLAWGGLPNYRSPHHVEHELPLQQRFLAAMVGAGLPRLVVTGTCFEYGMESGALAESAEPRPVVGYAVAKDRLRQALVREQQQAPFSLTWARLFYLWGDGQRENSLWPSLQRAAARGDATFPMSAGEQWRDYLPAPEAARLLVALALHGGDAGIVNVCSGRPQSLRELVERWIREHGWSIRPDYGRYPYLDYEPMRFWGDRSKLDTTLHDTDRT